VQDELPNAVAPDFLLAMVTASIVHCTRSADVCRTTVIADPRPDGRSVSHILQNPVGTDFAQSNHARRCLLRHPKAGGRAHDSYSAFGALFTLCKLRALRLPHPHHPSKNSLQWEHLRATQVHGLDAPRPGAGTRSRRFAGGYMVGPAYPLFSVETQIQHHRLRHTKA
jgi:hypothetical protein